MKLKVITAIALVLAVTLFSLGLPSVSAPDIYPLPTYVSTPSNETFVLPFKMKFNETDDGFFTIKFYWDVNHTDPNSKYWNFTYEGVVVKFTDGTNFSVSIIDYINKDVPYGYPPGYYRYTVGIYEFEGEPKNGDFWLNVTIRAAGLVNGVHIPHVIGDQNITIINVRCYELSTYSVGPEDCTIHVTGERDVAVTDVSLYHYYRAAPPGHRYQPLVSPNAYPTWIDPIDVRVAVKNEGDFNESFIVEAFYGNAGGNYTLGMQNVTLAPGANTTLTFAWDVPDIPFAWPYPIYLFSANATSVPGETDTDDNTYIDSSVTVKWPGDANGDGKVGLPGLMVVAMSYKADKGEWGYNPEADFDGDGSIYLLDLMILAMNYDKGPLD